MYVSKYIYICIYHAHRGFPNLSFTEEKGWTNGPLQGFPLSGNDYLDRARNSHYGQTVMVSILSFVALGLVSDGYPQPIH